MYGVLEVLSVWCVGGGEVHGVCCVGEECDEYVVCVGGGGVSVCGRGWGM